MASATPSTPRLQAPEADRKVPNSASHRASRALLRDIDWALTCGSSKWTDSASREQACIEFAGAGIAWRFEGHPASGRLIPHTADTIGRLASRIMAPSFRAGYEATAQALYLHGSAAVRDDALEAMNYDSAAEIAAIHRLYRQADPQRMSYWSTFAVDKDWALHTESEDDQAELPGRDAEGEGDEVQDDDPQDEDFGVAKSTGTSWRSDPAVVARRRRCQDRAIRAVGKYLDRHCKGKSDPGATRHHAETIAQHHTIEYCTTRGRRFQVRKADQYLNLMKEQVRQYNENRPGEPQKSIQDLLRGGSAMMPGYQRLQRAAADTAPEASGRKSSSAVVVPADEAAASDVDEYAENGETDSRGTTVAASTDGDVSSLAEDSSIAVSAPAPLQETQDALPSVEPSYSQDVFLRGGPKYAGAKHASAPELRPSPRLKLTFKRSLPPYESGSEEDVIDVRPAKTPRTQSHVSREPSIQVIEDDNPSAEDPALGTTSALPPSFSLPAVPVGSSAVSLKDRDLDGRLTLIYNTLKAGVRDLLGDDADLPACFLLHPSQTLRTTYDVIFGPERKGTVKQQIETNLSQLKSAVAVAVAGATLCEKAFNSDASSKFSFAAYLASRQKPFTEDLEFLNAELSGMQSDFDTLMRHVYLRYISSARFYNHPSVKAVCRKMRDSIMSDILEHVNLSGDLTTEQREAVTQFEEEMVKVVKDCLILKCETSCAREEYRFGFSKPGKPFTDHNMRDVVHGEARAQVLIGVFPGLARASKGGVDYVSKSLVRTADSDGTETGGVKDAEG